MLENLFDYQRRDVEFAKPLMGVLNANRMGYGKTVEALAMIHEWDCKRVLIVCPKAVLSQWQSEIQKWLGRPPVINPTKIPTDANTIVIANYDQLANGTFEFKGKYKFFHPGPRLQMYFAFQWDVIICDEAHRIKNPDAKVSRALNKIPAKRCVAMTGTPILSRPNDLYNLLHWIGVISGGYWAFVHKYCNIERGPFGDKILGATNDEAALEDLKRVLGECMIHNPDLKLGEGKRVDHVVLDMPPKQKKLYHDVKNLVLQELPDNCTIFNGMARTIRLRQVTSCPEMFGCPDNIKYAWILEMCEDNEDTPLVVFSKFAKAAFGLQEYLLDHKISCVSYTGDMDSNARQIALSLFKSRKAQVLVGTIGAMGTGIDGLQHVCNTAIFMDREWNPGINEQAEDRLNRIGQKHLVNVYVLDCKGSIDKYVGSVNLNKAADIRRILE